MNLSNTNTPRYQKTALLLSLLLAALALCSLFWIWRESYDNSPSTGTNSGKITADIFQNGELLQSISLDSVEEPYTFTVTGDNDCRNEIEVRPGSIGIISADCPDKLCVHQGFIHSSLLPITCLPNHLVIQIRTENNHSENDTVDIVTY